MIQRIMTAEEFAENRIELPDAGQWAELVRGVPVTLEPPDLDHGTIVLNLSKAFARYVEEALVGYPCFDLGLKVESRPDTVLFPAISYFLEGDRFAEADYDYTETVPALVVELITTTDRRRNYRERIGVYQRHGVQTIWLVDSLQRTVHVVERAQLSPRRISEFETLRGAPLLEGFAIPVAELFEEPDWAK